MSTNPPATIPASTTAQLALLEPTFAALDAFVGANNITSLLDGSAGGFSTSLKLASAMGQLKAMLTPEVMVPIMDLQGSALGFRTDKDKDGGYQIGVVRETLIEAVLKGFRPTGNEFNIIGGRFYAARDGFERIFRDMGKSGQLTNLRLQPGIPKTTGDGAIVEYAATWTFKNSAGDSINDELKLSLPIRVNSGQGPDAVLGKAKRKMLAAIYSRITGTEITDGDIDDPRSVTEVAATPVETKAEPKASADQIAELEKLLKAHEEKANAYLVSINAIKAGQTFRDVAAPMANTILGKKKQAFLDAAGIK